MSETVDIKGAAELMKVHPNTVFKLINSCAIPAARPGRAYVMLKKDILDYLQKCIVQETSERMRQPIKSAKSEPRKLA